MAPSSPPERIHRQGLRLEVHRTWCRDHGWTEASLLDRLLADIPWRRDTITLFGRTHLQPRLMCWMGDPGAAYRYSGREQPLVPWHPEVSRLREALSVRAGCRFNSVLLNLYRTGDDSMGWHADDEPELDGEAPIASLSLGHRRTLLFRPRERTRRERVSLELGEGDLLLMEPPTQRHWRHALPRRRRVGEARVNLTFRRVR
jgi:alkylated DNA repair dioxygenase AlkB